MAFSVHMFSLTERQIETETVWNLMQARDRFGNDRGWQFFVIWSFFGASHAPRLSETNPLLDETVVPNL